jgi:hypothetical protein
VKSHNGVKSVNKTDGGKRRARKALHKSVRQLGKKLSLETDCLACNDERTRTQRFPMADHTCVGPFVELKPCPICLGPAVRHPHPQAMEVLCGCADNDCIGKMWQGVDYWQHLVRPSKPIQWKRTV